MADRTSRKAPLDDTDRSEEFELYQRMLPYIGRCLRLNHDINNPLAGIIGYAEFMLEESKGLSQSQTEYLNQILECAERIRREVDTLCEHKVDLGKDIDLQLAEKLFPKIPLKSD